MQAHHVAGVWLVAGLIVFLVGAAGWRLAYEKPLADALGAVCWIVSLAFRLTVVPWAAERTVEDGDPPEGFAALDRWAGSLYVVHMSSAYPSFALLGAAVLLAGAFPAWSGWLGVAWGLGFLVGFVATRFAGPFNPPFWAHAYMGVLGVVMLTS